MFSDTRCKEQMHCRICSLAGVTAETRHRSAYWLRCIRHLGHATDAHLSEALELPLWILHILQYLQRDLPDPTMDPFHYLRVHHA